MRIRIDKVKTEAEISLLGEDIKDVRDEYLRFAQLSI